jgi:hypothetical protein
MRRWILYGAFLAIAIPAATVVAQRGLENGPGEGATPVVISAERSDVSPPLRHMSPKAVQRLSGIEIPRHKLPRHRGPNAPAAPVDPVVQDSLGGPSLPVINDTFEGLDNLDNQYAVLPPDANGDVGPNHYFQTVNLSFAIYSKGGGLLYGPFPGNTIFSGFGGPCEARNDGDPVVLYDHLADRWLFSQFAMPNGYTGPFYQCIAISATPDPLGDYYRYQYAFEKLNDYAKFGVWPDGYYLAINQYDAGSLGWGGQGVAVFERAQMLQGKPARGLYFDDPDPDLGGMLPADLDGPPPPVGTPNYFMQLDDDAWGYSDDQLELWAFHTNWNDPSSSTFTQVKTLPTAAFDSNLCGYSRNCIPQPGGTPVDAISDRLMFRLQYRNFGNYQTLVTNHTVDVDGTDHAGVRWYELINDQGSGWIIDQEGTFAPDGDHRWMGSVAMNGVGDIALGYSVSSDTTYPSIRFTGRLAGDPLGSMTQGEGTIVNGGGSQSTSLGRWGDYSSMSVDPTDDCTFWYTQEYYPSDSYSGWHTRIGSFTLADCGPVDTPPSVTLIAPPDGATVSGSVDVTLAATASDDNGVEQVEFFVDGYFIGTAINEGDGWSLTWTGETTSYSDGSHTVTAEAMDTIGQTGSDSITVTVANNPVHVADLNGSSADLRRGRWEARVGITIVDSDGPVSEATVSGSWSDGASGTASCTTTDGGQCTVSVSDLKGNIPSVIFTVDDVTRTGVVYDPSDNIDPDGDSDGTAIEVCHDGCTTAPPAGDASLIHIGDLDGTSTVGKGNKWNASVAITAHDEFESPAHGVTVTGEWSGAASGSDSCTTDSTGTCSVAKNNLRGTPATFSVTDILDSLGVSIYSSGANHDPDEGEDRGDTWITLTQP